MMMTTTAATSIVESADLLFIMFLFMLIPSIVMVMDG
jgi:hypothetical protein